MNVYHCVRLVLCLSNFDYSQFDALPLEYKLNGWTATRQARVSEFSNTIPADRVHPYCDLVFIDPETIDCIRR